jgi:hypothetical protein
MNKEIDKLCINDINTTTSGNTLQYQTLIDSTNKDLISTFRYNIKLPKNIDIFNDIIKSINTIETQEMREFIKKLIYSLKYLLIINNDSNTISNHLSNIKMSQINDGSVLLEWIYDNFRIGFSVEPNIIDSSYYIVTDDNVNGSYMSISKHLRVDEFDSILKDILQFVLRNT